MESKFSKMMNLFKCPICNESMVLLDKSFKCSKNHCFDIARKGYINFLNKPSKSEYHKELLASRQIISKNKFFSPMLESIKNIILDNTSNSSCKILDAGCGEGSHLSEIISSFPTHVSPKGIGIDISKDGIQIASSSYKDLIWVVGNLADTPFSDSSFDFIINILSPSNYKEFKRLLKPNGLLIKIVPGSDYLKELREIFYNKTDKIHYSNENIITHFKDNFNLVNTFSLKYKANIDKHNLPHLIKMTPLSWKAADEGIDKLLNKDLKEISVEFMIIIGKNEA